MLEAVRPPLALAAIVIVALAAIGAIILKKLDSDRSLLRLDFDHMAKYDEWHYSGSEHRATNDGPRETHTFSRQFPGGPVEKIHFSIRSHEHSIRTRPLDEKELIKATKSCLELGGSGAGMESVEYSTRNFDGFTCTFLIERFAMKSFLAAVPIDEYNVISTSGLFAEGRFPTGLKDLNGMLEGVNFKEI